MFHRSDQDPTLKNIENGVLIVQKAIIIISQVVVEEMPVVEDVVEDLVISLEL